ncbi:cytochrome P450 [Gloeophyllum trabeum ATCC 11539]|uniref:Cytochrome P450 n=1 Tax=Gloeophyllum trabeum (strain ATCC 11539 / FP-39264 / Madison 617) TaxID=670483 RepID=S7QAC8_GLOTA|nr:cytochrome P450 [Gloeophyllum trabeum ATCC 11539]EPQ56876.1 cytochrome P450 [Gloeophyllum trabeum ATCC 11539]
MIVALALGLAVLPVFFVVKQYARKRASNPSTLPYPPGPKPLPIVGNHFDIPKKTPWKTYAAWGRDYGELIHLNVLGQHYIILNSKRVTVDLLEKRNRIYSDRPIVPMIQMMGWDWNIGLMPYGLAWRQRRREFHQQFTAAKSKEYHPTVTSKAHELLRNLLGNPEAFLKHIQHYTAAISMAIAYNYEVASSNDEYVAMVEASVDMLGHATFPGAVIANAFPILRHLPAWLPGMRFKRFAEACRKLTTEMKRAPYHFVKARIDLGVPTKCVTSELIGRFAEDGKLTPESEDVIKDVGAITYAAGADTSSSAASASILAMVLYPEATNKAQAEIDRVIGKTRLPSLEDRPSLPYVEAFFRELIRWHSITPLSVPRAALEDDIYDGYFIPKGTIVLQNTWAIHHDERIYDEPEVFKPERFLNSDGSISDEYPIMAFGHGRRICPGRHLADAMIWTEIALVLAGFDITKAKDEKGHDIDPPVQFTDTIISHPEPFMYKIHPRSKEFEVLINETSQHLL